MIASMSKHLTMGNYKKKTPQGTCIRRVWSYQRGYHNPYIEEEQTTQWQKEKVQKDRQRSTKHTHKTKDRVTRTPLKTGGELSSCSTSGTRRDKPGGKSWLKKGPGSAYDIKCLDLCK
jgi:hypothetical protein